MCMVEKDMMTLFYQLCTQANLDHTPTQSDKYLYG